MNTRALPTATFMLLVLMLPVSATATPVTATNAASSFSVVEDFNQAQAVFSTFSVGTLATIGESFAGQTVAIAGGFESVSGTPSGPLSLQAPQTGGVITFGGIELQGLLANAPLVDSNIGEGAISILLAGDHLEMGLDLVKANSGTISLQFFERSGAVFDTVNLSFSGDRAYTFASTNGIDRFAGVTITNVDDAFGIAIDNLRLDSTVPAASIPEPTTIVLLGLGLAGIGFKRRQTA